MSKQILSRQRIIEYMQKHFASWLELANHKFGAGLKEDELLFVSGTTKTTKWAVAAFHGQFRSKQGSVSADFGGTAGIDFSVSISSETLPTSYCRTGPARSTLSAIGLSSESQTSQLSAEKRDQCIFIHFYKMKRRWVGRPFPMHAAGGPHKLPPGDNSGSDASEMVCVADDEANQDVSVCALSAD